MPTPEVPERNANWQRVSPVAALYFILRFMRYLIAQATNWLPLLIVVLINETLRQWALRYGLLALGGVSLVAGVAQYFNFRYQVDADRLHLQQGVLSRQMLTLAFNRIQQADIRLPWYYRPFGLVTLNMESAGSTAQEVAVSGIPRAQAESLRELILSHSERPGESDKDAGRSDVRAADFRHQLPTSEILRHGMLHNGVLILATILMPVVNSVLQNLQLNIEDWLTRLASQWSFSDGQWILISVALALALVVVLVSLSVLVGLVRYHGYELTRQADRFQYRAGLFTVVTRSVRQRRMQMLSFRMSWIGRLLQRSILTIHKAGDHAANGAAADSQRFVVPVLSADLRRSLMQQLGLPQRGTWQHISRWWMLFDSISTLFALVVIMAVVTLMLGFSPWWWLALVLSVLWLLGTPLRWRRLTLYRDADWLAMSSGLIGNQTRWMPVAKIQSLRLYQPLWQRSAGVATLIVQGAGGQLVLPCLPSDQAEQWRDELLCALAMQHEAWY